MRSPFKTLLIAIVFCTSAGGGIAAETLALVRGINLQAQEANEPSYNLIDYMKVAPGMHQEYLELEAVWKKIHQSNVDAGRYNSWSLSRVMMPSGAASSHNYVTRINFTGAAQFAAYQEDNFFPDNIEDILTYEEMALMRRTSEIRTWVKSEVFTTAEFIRQEELEPEVMVFNYFSSPEGTGWRDHFRVERDIWMPVHQARIDAGEMEGWVLLRKKLPYGANEPYHSATVDIYESLEEFLNLSSPVPTLEAIHGADKLEELFEQTDAAATLLLGEVRISLDRTTPKAE